MVSRMCWCHISSAILHGDDVGVGVRELKLELRSDDPAVPHVSMPVSL